MALSFFDLPLEIRLQIYGLAFYRYDGASTNYPTLVCKQMRQETLPVLFTADTTHRYELDGLVRWINKAPRTLLPAVRDVGIRWGPQSFEQMKNDSPWSVDQIVAYADSLSPVDIEPEDAKPTTPSKPKSSGFRSKLASKIRKSDRLPETPGIVPEGSTIEKAVFCFHAIQNTRRIWISLSNADRGQRSNTENLHYGEQQQLLLDIMSVTLIDVQELTFFSNLVHLDFMGRFHQVRQLRFTGYSKSTPEELLSIFKSMDNLHSLILYRYPKHYDYETDIVTEELPKYLSLTPEVLSGMHPLKYIWVSHMESSLQSPFATVPFIRAMNAHVESIQFLRVGLDGTIDSDALETLVDFVIAASQRNLRKIRFSFGVPESFAKKLPIEDLPNRGQAYHPHRVVINDLNHVLALRDESSAEG